MAVLSFFFPVIGWILWAVKKNNEPREAYKCAKWAWIGFGTNILLIILSAALA